MDEHTHDESAHATASSESGLKAWPDYCSKGTRQAIISPAHDTPLFRVMVHCNVQK
ncbi:hypothetical protein KIN20_038168 [Parelaphostrongylus tenuis]|uniref:Uncharacterized protein n=1 Tax=Parelaphostrongylus tenuis TaxID=148309 RepID=A0AAD5RFK2_PARTN|nr:hypothetical protein KIN20_038168 [Parelaphostrongylus tenuis]